MKSVNNLALLIFKESVSQDYIKMKKLKIQRFGQLSEAYLTLPRVGIKKFIFAKNGFFETTLKRYAPINNFMAGCLDYDTTLIDEDGLMTWRDGDTQVRVLWSQ